MTHQWADEPILDSDIALQLIKEQFPELEAKTIRLLGIGWDNKAFLINDTIIFRFPRRQVAVPLLENEYSVLPQIAPYLSLSIPVPLWAGKPSKNFPWPFTGYRMLSGFTADQADLGDEERERMAEPLARFLSELHNIDVTQLKNVSLKDTFQKLDIPALISKIITQLHDAKSLGLLNDIDGFLKIAESATELKLETKLCVVHGDLYSRHLLVDANHSLIGIIDWGDTFISNPAIDLIIAHSFLPSRAHEKFKKIYGPISEEQWTFARLRALYHSSILVLYGTKINDRLLVREGQKSLGYIAEQI